MFFIFFNDIHVALLVALELLGMSLCHWLREMSLLSRAAGFPKAALLLLRVFLRKGAIVQKVQEIPKTS